MEEKKKHSKKKKKAPIIIFKKIFKPKNFVREDLTFMGIRPTFVATLSVQYNNTGIRKLDIRLQESNIGLKSRDGSFEKVITFKNFKLKKGRSETDAKDYDVLVITASKTKITFFFKEETNKSLFKNLYSKLSKFCILSSLLKDYEVIKPLGKGGFATVYLMRRKSDNEEFAVKILKKEKIQKIKELRYLISEVDIMRIVSHRNIVKTHEIHELDKYVGIVQDYLDGSCLQSYIKKHIIEEYTAVQISHDILLALSYLHDLDYIHRDIKPGNIMLRKKICKHPSTRLFKAKFDIILIDFGLCARSDDFTHNSFLKDRSGTVGYLAPELIEKEYTKWYNKKVDIYSLGIVLVEMLTGLNPFKTDDYRESMLKNYKNVIELDRFVKEDTRNFLSCVLNRNPDKRASAVDALENPVFCRVESAMDLNLTLNTSYLKSYSDFKTKTIFDQDIAILDRSVQLSKIESAVMRSGFFNFPYSSNMEYSMASAFYYNLSSGTDGNSGSDRDTFKSKVTRRRRRSSLRKSLIGKQQSARLSQSRFQNQDKGGGKQSRFKTQEAVTIPDDNKDDDDEENMPSDRIVLEYMKEKENISNCDHDNPVGKYIHRYQ